MTISIASDSLRVSESTSASVAGIDHRGRPMTVGFVAWTSSDPTVARLGSDGSLLGLRQGTVVITAAVGTVIARRTLTIGAAPPGPLPVASVAVSPLQTTLGVGQSTPLTATLRDFAGVALTDRAVAWVSSDDSIVVVSSTGVVTARNPGTAVIEAVSETQRSGAVITVKAEVDTTIVLTIASPMSGEVVADTALIVATVRAVFPIDSVVAVIADHAYPLVLGNLPVTGKGPAWVVKADVSSLPYGTGVIVVTATDRRGKRAVAVVAFVRDPKLTPGSKAPTANK